MLSNEELKKSLGLLDVAIEAMRKVDEELSRSREHNSLLTADIEGWKKNVDLLREKSRLMEEAARASDQALTEWEMSAPPNGPILRALEATTVARKALHRALNANPVESYKSDIAEARRERDRLTAHTHTLGRHIEVLEHDLADQTQTLSILLTNGDPTLTFDDCFQRVEALQTSVVVLAERVNELEAELKQRPPAGAESTAGPTEAIPKAARRDPSPQVDQSQAYALNGEPPLRILADVAASLPTSAADEAIVDVRMHEVTKDLKVTPFRVQRDPWAGVPIPDVKLIPDEGDALKRRVSELETRIQAIEESERARISGTNDILDRLSKLEGNALLDRELERKRAEPPRPAGVVTMAELEGGTGGGIDATTVTGWNDSRQRLETPQTLPSAKGERCTMCHGEAALKVEQSDPPQTDSLAGHPVYAHPFTAYVCEPCFRWIMFGERLSLLPVGSRVIVRDGYGESAGRVLSVGTLDAGWQYTPGVGSSHYEIAFDLNEGHGYIPREQVRLEAGYATTLAKPGERLVPREQP